MDRRKHDNRPEIDRRSHGEQIRELYDKLCDLEERLDPVIEVWSALSGVAKVLKWLGIAVKWIMIFVGLGLAFKGLGK